MTKKVIKKAIVGIIAVMFGTANAWNVLDSNDIQNHYNSVVATSCQAFELSDLGIGSNWAYDEPREGTCLTIVSINYPPFAIPMYVKKTFKPCCNGEGNCIVNDGC